MRIALVVEKFGIPGGAERQVGMLARDLAARGHSVHVVAGTVSGETAGVAVEAVGGRGRLDFAERARRAVRGFDVVHSFARTLSQDILRLGGGIHAEYLKRMEGVRSLVGRLFSRVNPKERRILGLERRSFDPSATRILQAVSRRVRDEAVTHYGISPDRIVVTHNSVDTERFNPGLRSHRDSVRGELGLPSDASMVLFVGSGFRRKGLDRAVEAVARLERPGFLVVIGKGGTGPYERQARRRKVRGAFLGPRPDVERFYGAADVLVLPTLYDPFPNVVLEAAACGTPAVVTRVAGVSEVMEDGAGGFVVDDPGEPDALAARLAEALDGGDAMRRAARALAKRRPFPRYVDETLELYERVL